MTSFSSSPTEPLETLEPSTHFSAQRQPCGDQDGSVGQRDETAARVKALGIQGPLFQPFACVLPGHAHKARVNPTTQGYWLYRCDDLKQGIGLAEVRAFLAYGNKRHLSGVEAARWRERLDFEAGLRWPIPLHVQMPEPCPEAARIVAGKMREFVGLRSEVFSLSEPFVFASEFAQAYTGLTTDQIRAAKSWLERAGVLHRVGTHGRSILWKLAAQDDIDPPHLSRAEKAR